MDNNLSTKFSGILVRIYYTERKINPVKKGEKLCYTRIGQ